MKKITTLLLFLTFTLFSFSIKGQNPSVDKELKIAVVKTTATNGHVTVRKVSWESKTNLDDFKKEFGLGLPFIREVDVQIIGKGSAADNEISEQNVYNVSDLKEVLPPVKVPSYQVAETSSNAERLKNLQKRKRPIPRFIPVFLENNPEGNGVLIVGKMKRYSKLTKQLKKGDILVSIEGNTISEIKEVFFYLGYSNKPVNLEVIRKGKRIEILNQSHIQVDTKIDRTQYDYKNPCQVFIGMSHDGRAGQVNRVSRIIENTAAEKMGLQKGDLIVSLNGNEVLTRQDLLDERNENDPGDFFTLKIFRKGKKMKLKGQFGPCEETAEIAISEKASELRETTPNQELVQPQKLQVFPNPTNGAFSIKLRLSDNSPAEILVTNILGEIISYNKVEVSDINYLKRDFNLKNQAAGTYLISVTQNGKIYTEKIILK